ncbi:MAG: metal-dependent transcriptional regulator [Clostridia bacterium]|nr:metal-dependent transcriptional regulator [Clostridia bacterium]
MLILKEKNGYVRSIDVASQLNVTKPSVTYTTKRLRERGLITMDRDNLIQITDEGLKIASKTYKRHVTLKNFFMMLGVSEEAAEDDACKVEHDLSEETFDAFCAHVKKYSPSDTE